MRRCMVTSNTTASRQPGYGIEAVRTQYAGIRFRSQLEATWAAFFDVVGMPWEYEPIRTPGWVPDFRLYGRFLCEVKPVAMTGFAHVSSDYRWFKKAIGDQQALLFGSGPTRDALCCMASMVSGQVSGRTVFYDPNAEFKMVSVPDDGGSHPLRGSAEWAWREAWGVIRRTGRRV